MEKKKKIMGEKETGEKEKAPFVPYELLIQ